MNTCMSSLLVSTTVKCSKKIKNMCHGYMKIVINTVQEFFIDNQMYSDPTVIMHWKNKQCILLMFGDFKFAENNLLH